MTAPAAWRRPLVRAECAGSIVYDTGPMSVSDAERRLERGDEHEVTPLELFFDLTLVFAMTQVTILLADDPT